MSLATHFMSPTGEKVPISGAELVTVEVPAEGSADLGDWEQAEGGAYYMRRFTDALAGCAVLPSCTDPSAITDHGLRIEFDEQLQGWVAWIDSLPEIPCTLTLLFIHHGTEDKPCVLPALGIGTGIGTGGGPAATYYTVRIPAAGSENMYGWYALGDIYELQIMDVDWMKESLFVELKSENAELFTKHDLTLHQDDGFLDFSIDTLPEKESVLYIYVPTVVNGGQLNGGES